MFKNDKNQGYNSQMFGEDDKAYFNESSNNVPGGGYNGLNYSVQGSGGQTLASYATKTFLWMFAGLIATFATSLIFFASGLWVSLFSVSFAPYMLLIAELVVVMALSARLHSMKSSTAVFMFFLYAVLNGFTLTTFFVLFDMVFLIFVFLLTALFFGGLAAYGFLTKSDLTKLRPILVGGLIFLMLYFVVGIFINLSSFDLIASVIGLIIFMALTAYDTQKMKAYYQAYSTNSEMMKKSSIICALQLYLDFINIFLYLIRILGRKR